MSTVRKASVLHPEVPVVIDLTHVSVADFSTAYVRHILFLSTRFLAYLVLPLQGFDNLAEDMHKKGHPIVITRAHPRILTILESLCGSKLHVHRDGTDLDILLQGKG